MHPLGPAQLCAHLPEVLTANLIVIQNLPMGLLAQHPQAPPVLPLNTSPQREEPGPASKAFLFNRGVPVPKAGAWEGWYSQMRRGQSCSDSSSHSQRSWVLCQQDKMDPSLHPVPTRTLAKSPWLQLGRAWGMPAPALTVPALLPLKQLPSLPSRSSREVPRDHSLTVKHLSPPALACTRLQGLS